MKKALFGILVFFVGFSVHAESSQEWINNCVSNKNCLKLCEYDLTYRTRDGSSISSPLVEKKSKFYVYYELVQNKHTPPSRNPGKLVLHSPELERKGPKYFVDLFKPPNYYKYTYMDDTRTRKERDFEHFACPPYLWISTQPQTAYMLCMSSSFLNCETIEYWTGRATYKFHEDPIYSGGVPMHFPRIGQLTYDHQHDSFKKSVENTLNSIIEEEIEKYVNENFETLQKELTKAEAASISGAIYDKVFKSILIKQSNDYKSAYLHQLVPEELPAFFEHWLDEILKSNSVRQKILDALGNIRKKYEDLKEGGYEGEIADIIINITDSMEENIDGVYSIIDAKLKEYFEDSVLEEVIQTCDSIFGHVKNKEKPAYWIQLFLNIIRITGIAALLLLSAMDFFKATVAQDSDAMKKASGTSLKRLIYTIVLFFLPILIEFLFKILHLYDAIDMCKDVIS